MAIFTAQRINQLYDDFKTSSVTFNSAVTKALRLVSKGVYLKHQDAQWRCAIYSSTMVSAKLVINVDNKLLFISQKKDVLVSLRFCFADSSKGNLISFFVPAHIAETTPYPDSGTNLSFITLTFTSRPPDDMVIILGTFIEANLNSKKRTEERIPLTSENIRKLGFNPKEAKLLIGGVPRKCILKDLSFSGFSAVIPGVGKFLVSMKVKLQTEFEDYDRSIHLEGTVRRFDKVEGHRDITLLGIQFNDENIPIEYKMKINEFLSRKTKHPHHR